MRPASGTEAQNEVMPITWRRAQPDDEPFLYELYENTRAEEMDAFGWNAAQKEMFLRLQFNAQRQHYDIAYPDAEHRIILFKDCPAGRIMVFRSGREIVLVDIALLPGYRGGGIGTVLIRGLIDEAQANGLPLKLHVEKHNRAARLYERLGFSLIGETGLYYEMERRPHQ
jgi:ribosomal protein S18 acetylase RimI-like enzyme